MILRAFVLVASCWTACGTVALAAEPPALAKARAAYNAADFQGAIEAASLLRQQPQWADAAALVIARSHIERYRRTADPSDLTTARETLGSIRAAALEARDHVDLIVGLGQALYLGELFGAAAELFETALARAQLLTQADRMSQADRNQLLDWWATALDREAQSQAPDKRGRVYARITERAERALAEDPANPVANYWLAVAARGTGDLDRAWSAAIAAWIRASLDRPHAEQLRVDLDRLVSQALVPERARTRAARENEDAIAVLREEWDRVKEHWK
jgi:tetratricopeptide (TPR) repeat protein